MWMKPTEKPEDHEDLLQLELLGRVLKLGAEVLDHQAQASANARHLVVLRPQAVVKVADCIMLASQQVQQFSDRQQRQHEPGGLDLVLRGAVRREIDQEVRSLNGSHDQVPHAPVHHYEHVAALRLQGLVQGHPVARKVAQRWLEQVAQWHLDGIEALVDVPNWDAKPWQHMFQSELGIIQVQSEFDVQPHVLGMHRPLDLLRCGSITGRHEAIPGTGSSRARRSRRRSHLIVDQGSSLKKTRSR